MLFYFIIHLIDAWLDEVQGIKEMRDHSERKQKIKKWMPEIVNSFNDLYDISVKARYKCLKTPINVKEYLSDVEDIISFIEQYINLPPELQAKNVIPILFYD